MKTLKLLPHKDGSGWQVLEMYEGDKLLKWTYIKIRTANRLLASIYNHNDSEDRRDRALDLLMEGKQYAPWCSEMFVQNRRRSVDDLITDLRDLVFLTEQAH